jgi:acetyltransferase
MAASTFEIASVLEQARDQLLVRLKDTRVVTIRPILPSDLDGLRTFFTALSHAAVRFRFHSSLNELSERLLRTFTMVNHDAHVAFVAETDESAADKFTTIVAEARYVRSADSQSAEFALVVADDWRRVGLGTTLTRVLAKCARFAGVLRLCGDVLEDNKAMRGLAHSLGARLSREAGSRQTVRLSMEV